MWFFRARTVDGRARRADSRMLRDTVCIVNKSEEATRTRTRRSSCPIGQKLLDARLQLNATMALTALDKGKGKAVPDTLEDTSGSDSSSSLASGSDSDGSTSESESEDEVTPEYLESLLEKARQSAVARHGARESDNGPHEEEMIKLPGSTNEYVSSCLTSYLILTCSAGYCLY